MKTGVFRAYAALFGIRKSVMGFSSELYVLMRENEMPVPDFALMDPDGIGLPDTPRILISVLPRDHDLEKSRKESVSPAERMMQLLRACDVRIGLLHKR